MCNLVKLSEKMVVSIRTRAPVKDLPDVIGKCYGDIMKHLSSNGKYPSGVPFIGYFNMDMNDLDVEIGFPVEENVAETEAIKMSKIPEGSYAEHIHIGPYPTLKDGYDLLMKWMAESNYQATGICYEYYLNDPNEVKPEQLQTRILFQI